MQKENNLEQSLQTNALASPKVALMQPTFMPWLGYFALIKDADIFVFLDDFQFVRRSFDHRNRICDKTGKEIMFSLPIEHSGSQDVAFNQAKPLLDAALKKKILGSLTHNYSKSTHFQQTYNIVERWLENNYKSLADINMTLIKSISVYLGLSPRFAVSSEIPQKGQRSERILSLLNEVGAATYLCAKGARDYMQEDGVFPVKSCNVAFQDFSPEPYEQGMRPFVSHMSAIDALMLLGPDGTIENIEKSQKAYKSWDGESL